MPPDPIKVSIVTVWIYNNIHVDTLMDVAATHKLNNSN